MAKISGEDTHCKSNAWSTDFSNCPGLQRTACDEIQKMVLQDNTQITVQATAVLNLKAIFLIFDT